MASCKYYSKRQSTNGKEFDTYKVGTVANSCSTMHKIQAKEFTLDDFSYEHLLQNPSLEVLGSVISALNMARNLYLECEDTITKKDWWWQMIQLLPSSYNQKRTVQLSYEVIANMNRDGIRRTHKLDEWQYLCKEVFDNLPYYKEITKKITQE